MENRHGLVVGAQATQVVGASEPATALTLATAIPGEHRATLGGDKGYDTAAFVAGCRELKITPHVAQNRNNHRASAIDGRTTAYVCKKGVCKRPTSDPSELARQLGEIRRLEG